MRLPLKKIILNIILYLFFANLCSCSSGEKLTKQQLLKKSISELELRFEERKLGRILEYISENYQDESGRGLKDIKRAIHLQLLRHKSLYIFSTITDIEWLDESSASVQIATAMAGKPIKNVSLLESVRADMIKFVVLFVLEDNIYKVESASWEWADPSDFL